MLNDKKAEQPANAGDILLGLVSLVDQFGSLLSQRGRDFRQTERGQQVDRSLSAVFGDLSRSQQDGVNLLNSALDRLLAALNRQNGAPADANPKDNGKGKGNGSGSAPQPPGKNGRTAKQKSRRPSPPRKPGLSVSS